MLVVFMLNIFGEEGYAQLGYVECHYNLCVTQILMICKITKCEISGHPMIILFSLYVCQVQK
jgi:hypothetical protein